MAAESLKKVKILVLGDSGVGKTSLVHLICHKEVLSHTSWTVGCSVEVKLHDYSKTLSSSSYFLEFWDIGGSPSHSKGRAVFYQQANGLILVHDLTNRKSHGNLSRWLTEFHQSSCRDGGGRNGRGLLNEPRGDLEYDPEVFADQELPILIVGTKHDQVSTVKLPTSSGVTGAACINVDCTNMRQFTVDSQQTIELNKFFDKVIERRYFPSYRMVSEWFQLEQQLLPCVKFHCQEEPSYNFTCRINRPPPHSPPRDTDPWEREPRSTLDPINHTTSSYSSSHM